MAASDAWAADVDWPSPPRLGRRTRIVLALLLLSGAAGVILVVRATASDLSGVSMCRFHEAREGVPGLEKSGVIVGERPSTGWTAPPGAEVRYARSALPSGVVVDASWCPAAKQDHLVITLAR
jgi:hypothetical protein